MTTILITGKTGQLGWELIRALLPWGRVIALGHEELDLADTNAIQPIIDAIHPDVIINAAAYTAVDQAESASARAYLINAQAPAVLAEAALRHKALLIHYSTDYIFDGSKPTPYDEEDVPAPLNVYGASKLAGEERIRATQADHLILRTSWIYAARGRNFLRTMLCLAAERTELRVVADQIGTPTWARFIAEATARIMGQALQERQRGDFASDVYHLTATGQASWHQFAQAIIETARQLKLDAAPRFQVQRILPLASSDYPLPASRPLNSVLASHRIQARFGIHLPDWQTCLSLCMGEIV